MAKKNPKWKRSKKFLLRIMNKHGFETFYRYMVAQWKKQDRVTGEIKRARILWKQQRRRDEVKRIFSILKLGDPY